MELKTSQVPETLSELEDYVPISLWLRRDQLDRISNDAYNQSQTIYGFIRFIIDYYYDFINQPSEKVVDGRTINML